MSGGDRARYKDEIVATVASKDERNQKWKGSRDGRSRRKLTWDPIILPFV